MMTERAPLVPEHVDLTRFEFMPLQVRRLRDSGIASCENAEEFRAAVLLWCASWHQVPAASLPDDDKELAALANYGRFIGEWTRVRDGALHGFIKCSDGRWYHPVIAEHALVAWGEHLQFRMRGMKGRAKRDGKAFDPSEWNAQIIANQGHLSALRGEAPALRKRVKRQSNYDPGLVQLDLIGSPTNQGARSNLARDRDRDRDRDTKSKSKDQKHVRTPAAPARFAEFWQLYPRSEAKKQAHAVWKARNLDTKADTIIADVARRALKHRAWLEGFIPHATTYLRNDRWEDAIDERPARTAPTAKTTEMGKRAKAYFGLGDAIDELKRREQNGDQGDGGSADVVSTGDRGGRAVVATARA